MENQPVMQRDLASPKLHVDRLRLVDFHRNLLAPAQQVVGGGFPVKDGLVVASRNNFMTPFARLAGVTASHTVRTFSDMSRPQ